MGWKDTQLTPLSWPSRACLTMTSVEPKSSVDPGLRRCSDRPDGPGATFFLRRPVFCGGVVCGMYLSKQVPIHIW